MPSQPSTKLSPQAVRQRRLKRLLLGIALYAVIGFLILPPVLRWQLAKQLPKFTLRQAASSARARRSRSKVRCCRT
jgi:hypothetical protein